MSKINNKLDKVIDFEAYKQKVLSNEIYIAYSEYIDFLKKSMKNENYIERILTKFMTLQIMIARRKYYSPDVDMNPKLSSRNYRIYMDDNLENNQCKFDTKIIDYKEYIKNKKN